MTDRHDQRLSGLMSAMSPTTWPKTHSGSPAGATSSRLAGARAPQADHHRPCPGSHANWHPSTSWLVSGEVVDQLFRTPPGQTNWCLIYKPRWPVDRSRHSLSINDQC